MMIAPEIANAMKPTPSNWSRSSIERFAETIAAADAVCYSPSEDMGTVVERIGGQIAITDVWAGELGDGSLWVKPDGRFWIALPSHTSSRRDRFTVAHELGHYFLHYLICPNEDRKKGMIANRFGSDRVEWEANWFAAAFLMPEQKFQEVYSDFKGNIYQVANHFDVSEAAADIRSRALRLK